MKSFFQLMLGTFILLSSTQALARIQWSEPEVVPEKLVRKNRRVIRFSGTTDPGTLIRIKKNQVKMYLDNGRTRWANIPQKHAVQFPLEVSGDGSFTFDLYLPIVAVEIPIQVKEPKDKWRLSSLNFRVPDSGKADDFEAIEESFLAKDDSGSSSLDKSDGYYSRKRDKGLLIRDREGKEGYDDSKILAWGGLGLSYFSTTADAGLAYNSSGSGLAIPSFRFGIDYKFKPNVLLKAAVRSTSGSTDDISGTFVAGKDYNWLEAQLHGVWFADFMKALPWNLGLDLGFQLQQIPFFREREGFANLTYFDVSTYNLHVGLFYRSPKSGSYDYEIYGRYLYPISSGDAMTIESSFPLMFEFGGGVKKALSPGLAFGVFGQMEYFGLTTSYVNSAQPREVDLSLMLFTVDVRLMASF